MCVHEQKYIYTYVYIIMLLYIIYLGQGYMCVHVCAQAHLCVYKLLYIRYLCDRDVCGCARVCGCLPVYVGICVYKNDCLFLVLLFAIITECFFLKEMI